MYSLRLNPRPRILYVPDPSPQAPPPLIKTQMHTTCARVPKTTTTRQRSDDCSPPTSRPWRRRPIGQGREEVGEAEEEEEEEARRVHAGTILEAVFSKQTHAWLRRCIFAKVAAAAAVPPPVSRMRAEQCSSLVLVCVSLYVLGCFARGKDVTAS